jgi:hypothetical protein
VILRARARALFSWLFFFFFFPLRRSCAFMIPESSGGLSTASRSEERRTPLSLFSMTTTVLLLPMSSALCERWTFAPVNHVIPFLRCTRWASGRAQLHFVHAAPARPYSTHSHLLQPTGRVCGVYKGNAGSIRSLAVHPTLPYLAVGGLDR